MGTTFKSFLGGKDVKWWDGIARTFSRLTSTGGQLTLNKVGSSVDILEVYGAGITYSDATISDAVNKIGSRAVTLLFQPGTWTITNDITIPANISIMAPQGVTISIDTGKTLTVNGTIIAGSYQIFDGLGTVAGAPILCFKDPTWFSGTVTDSTSPTWKLTTLNVNTINETTSAAGVTIDSVLLKDNGVTATTVTATTATATNVIANTSVSTDTISEKTTDAGVTIDGSLIKDGDIKVDTITEKTSDAGITIDGCLIKDGGVEALSMSGEASITSATIPVELAHLIDVVAGDRIFISAAAQWSVIPNASIQSVKIFTSAGSATTIWLKDIPGATGIATPISNQTGGNLDTSSGGTNTPIIVSGILEVTVGGTLTISCGVTLLAGGAATLSVINGYYFFLKK